MKEKEFIEALTGALANTRMTKSTIQRFREIDPEKPIAAQILITPEEREILADTYAKTFDVDYMPVSGVPMTMDSLWSLARSVPC